MKVFNLLHIYQNSNIGGVQQQLLSLMKEYDRSFLNPYFCCLGPKGMIGAEMEKAGIECIALGYSRYSRFSPGIIRDLRRIMKEKNIHIVRTHKYRASLYGRIASLMAGVPVRIASFHGNYRKDKRWERKVINKVLAKATDRFVAVSSSIKQDLVRYDRIDPSNIDVIHNGVDTGRFSGSLPAGRVRVELGVGERDCLIGFIGRLVPAKGLDVLIDAVALLSDEAARLKVLIVGEGAIREALLRRAHEKGLGNRVIFAGQRRDIPEILDAVDVFVMPSLAEGLPNALLEAMASGKAIIATNAGGMPEVIQNNVSGVLVQLGDAEMLSAALRRVIGDAAFSSALGAEARRFIMEHYSMKAVARTWENLYRTLLIEKGFSV